MTPPNDTQLAHALRLLFQSHPWHGVDLGEESPRVVNVFVEIVPTDTVKYELDKKTGVLRVDRPQRFSNVCPSLYGFVPRTLCKTEVAGRCSERIGRPGIVGDNDPLDICVLTERPIGHGNVLVEAVPVGGFRMVDGNEADDKIIAVLEGDPAFGGATSIDELPKAIVDRLRHYFLTYKLSPDGGPRTTEIAEVYGREEAYEVIRRSHADYLAEYGHLAAFGGAKT